MNFRRKQTLQGRDLAKDKEGIIRTITTRCRFGLLKLEQLLCLCRRKRLQAFKWKIKKIKEIAEQVKKISSP